METHMEKLLAETTQHGIERAGEALMKLHLHQLNDIWEKLNLDPAQRVQRTRLTFLHLNNLLAEIVGEEQDFYDDIKKRVHKYLSKVGELSKVLLVPTKEVEGSLVQKEEVLRQELDELNALKEKRKEAYLNLKRTMTRYCQVLNMQEMVEDERDGPEVPSEDEIKVLENKVSELKTEKKKRMKNLRNQLTTILETTEVPIETLAEVDVEVLQGNGEDLLTFEVLEETLNKAKKIQEDLEARKEELMGQLNDLWTVLKTEDSHKVEFLSKHLDMRPSTLESIEKEVERCTEMKKENAKTVAAGLKKRLDSLWCECHVANHQRKWFPGETNDDNVGALEEEVQKWTQYKEEVQHILVKIEERQKLFDQMVAFEKKYSDPRRFKNRKGHLLQEERERKQLQKNLPALEAKLISDIGAYEAQKNAPFLYYGGDFRTYVANQWEERKNKKEGQRLERHKQYILKMKSELNSTGLPPAKRLSTGCHITPKSAPSKLVGTKRSDCTPDTSMETLTPNTVDRLVRRKRASLRQQVLKDKNRLTPSSSGNDSTTYSDFALSLQDSGMNRMQSSVLASKKRGGSRVSMKKRKPLRKKPARRSNAPKFTPVRGKYGLPFIL